MYTVIVSAKNGELKRLTTLEGRRAAKEIARKESVPGFCTAHVHFGEGPQKGKVRKFKRRGPPHPKRCGKESTADPFGTLLGTLAKPMPVDVRWPAAWTKAEKHYPQRTVVFDPYRNGRVNVCAEAVREGRLMKSGRRKTIDYEVA